MQLIWPDRWWPYEFSPVFFQWQCWGRLVARLTAVANEDASDRMACR